MQLAALKSWCIVYAEIKNIYILTTNVVGVFIMCVHCVSKYSAPICFQQTSFSVALMADVDNNYQFVLVDVGAPGRQSYGGVFKNSLIGCHLENGTLGLPGPARLPRTSIAAPHVFVGDDAFQLRSDFMRPYPGVGLSSEMRTFNYRLSQARYAFCK